MKKAFTLVEMLIVVVIIWILAAALIPRLVWAQSQARDVARKKNIVEISNALEFMYNDKWEYPNPNNAACKHSLCWNDLDPSNSVYTYISWYISNVPSDPQKWHKNYGHFAHPWQPSHCLWEYSYTVVSIKDYVDTIWWSSTVAAADPVWAIARKNANLRSFALVSSLEKFGKNMNYVEPLTPSNVWAERPYSINPVISKNYYMQKLCWNWVVYKQDASTSGWCWMMWYNDASNLVPCCETNDVSRWLFVYFSLN